MEGSRAIREVSPTASPSSRCMGPHYGVLIVVLLMAVGRQAPRPVSREPRSATHHLAGHAPPPSHSNPLPNTIFLCQKVQKCSLCPASLGLALALGQVAAS